MENLSTGVAAALRRAGRAYLTARARLQGKAFYCAALAGRSGINLCVNCDLSVSCSCHDVDGSGQIGDMAHQSLREVLAGPIAQRFREVLARGRLPTPLCARCCDLHCVAKDKAERSVTEHRLPRYLMVENTVACNLRCVSCPRKQVRRLRKRMSMSLDDVRRVARELKDTGIRTVASGWGRSSDGRKISAGDRFPAGLSEHEVARRDPRRPRTGPPAGHLEISPLPMEREEEAGHSLRLPRNSDGTGTRAGLRAGLSDRR